MAIIRALLHAISSPYPYAGYGDLNGVGRRRNLSEAAWLFNSDEGCGVVELWKWIVHCLQVRRFSGLQCVKFVLLSKHKFELIVLWTHKMDSQNQPLSPKDEPAPISYATPSSRTICLTLFIICLVSTNNYFSYHAPSATAEEFEISYNLNTQQFGTLFTIYSAPNIILVFFSGMVIDKYGVRFSSLVFNTLILVGMVLCATTPFPSANISSTATYASLLLGRFLLGLGGESIVACTTSMISKWFTSTGYLNTAMAVNQAAVQLLGSSAAFFILPRVNNFGM